MKDGYYTIINRFEYKIEQRQSLEVSQEGPGYVYPYSSSEIAVFGFGLALVVIPIVLVVGIATVVALVAVN